MLQKKEQRAVVQTKKLNFGKRSGLTVYPVSIGAMRLPETDKAIALIRQAIDAGMIYIDTSRGYEDSEIKLGKALKDGYREKVILSTKCSPWCMKVEPDDNTSAECTYKNILDSMKRLDVEYLDFYQVWNIDTPEHYEQAVEPGGMVDGIRQAMKEGLVRHTGFTTHDTPENISRYIQEADWCEAILFTYNMFNKTYQQTLAEAHQKGIATIVMNPIAGGVFAQGSESIASVVKRAIGIDDPIEAAHRYLAGDENVDTIICGISKLSDITSTLANYQKPPLTPEQRRSLEVEFEKMSPENTGFCTNCGYCQPCPVGIKIPQLMNVAYYAKIMKAPARAQELYNWWTNPGNDSRTADPSSCSRCGSCEQKCTQKIKIIDLLKYIDENYSDNCPAVQ